VHPGGRLGAGGGAAAPGARSGGAAARFRSTGPERARTQRVPVVDQLRPRQRNHHPLLAAAVRCGPDRHARARAVAHPQGRKRNTMMATLRSPVTRAGAALLCGALFLAGCTAGDGGSGGTLSDDRRQTLIIAENEPPATFDPVQADNSTVDEVVTPLYDSLLTFNSQGGLVGHLATDWEVSEDATAITLTLRDDVTFHDGTPLTAKDVQYTLDRINRLNIGVAAELQPYESTEVIDDTTMT